MVMLLDVGHKSDISVDESRNHFQYQASIGNWRINICKLIREEFGEVTVSLCGRKILKVGVVKLVFKLHNPSVFVVIEHGSNAIPSYFGRIINHKDKVEDVLCERCIHPLQHNNVDTTPNVRIPGFEISCRADGLFIMWRDDMIEQVWTRACTVKSGDQKR